MATYDGERFLPEMLESLAAQTRPPDELVVRDDASEDGTVRILHAFARRMPFRVEVIAGGPRLGYAQNFIAASNACSGGLVFFADQDDVWRPHKLASVVSQVRRHRRPRAIFHDFAIVDEGGHQKARSYYELLRGRGLPPELSLKGCSVAVTRGFLQTWGWPQPDAHVSHDFWVALLSTAFGQRSNLDDQLIDHRLHGGNASGWIPDSSSRVFTIQGDGSSATRLLVDLVLKPPWLGARTRALLDVLDRRGDAVDPEAAHRLRGLLRDNRRRHRGADAS
jgi:glycosyltransferase involved in cell wall biosynthesis